MMSAMLREVVDMDLLFDFIFVISFNDVVDDVIDVEVIDVERVDGLKAREGSVMLIVMFETLMDLSTEILTVGLIGILASEPI